MWRIKALCLAMVLSLMTAAAAETLLSPEEAKSETANYKTVTVEMGSYIEEFTGRGEEYYPVTVSVACEISNATFVEYTVRKGDFVEKGDVLAILAVNTDAAALSVAQLNLENAKASLEKQREEREEQLAEVRDRAFSVSDPLKKELARLELEKLQVQLEQMVYRMERDIAMQQENVDEMLQAQEQTVLVAPVSGEVDGTTYKQENERVYEGESLVQLLDTRVLLLKVEDSAGELRYNMPVTLTFGRNKEQIVVSGRVVAADNLLPENLRIGRAFVQIDPAADLEELNMKTIQVKAEEVRVDDVMVIPRRALSMSNGKSYVNLLEDGMVRRRYVNNVAFNPSDVWLLQGVSAGDTLLLN